MRKSKLIAFLSDNVRIRKNVVEDLDEYHCDPEEWQRVSTDLVSYAVFYSNCTEQLLKAGLLYSYDVVPFVEKTLIPETAAQLSKEEFQQHHYGLLRDYAINRAAAGLLSTGYVDPEHLKTASEYHIAHLKQYGYSDELDMIKELDTESMLSNLLPQIIVNRLMGIDYERITSQINPAIKSREKIWMYAWQFLSALSDASEQNLEPLWDQLIDAWRACFVNSNFHAFSNSLLVLLYYAYCEKQQQPFNLSHLSAQILTPSSSD